MAAYKYTRKIAQTEPFSKFVKAELPTGTGMNDASEDEIRSKLHCLLLVSGNLLT